MYWIEVVENCEWVFYKGCYSDINSAYADADAVGLVKFRVMRRTDDGVEEAL